ncbi:elongation factor G-2, mitochondrial [Medicago truncatula]|uniref:elongation factor G-2, mitochondrial n=1 Tax=Medicago truncatula TaxID=3880 RepID=UPI000D2F1585|nr:elongation factor G-2, mitochondrial [Medicago truncatula]
MNRFFSRSSFPLLLYSTVRSSSASSIYPSSSVLPSPLHLRHFSNKSVEKLRHVWMSGYDYVKKRTDREIVLLESHRYPNYEDPRFVYEDEIDNIHTKTYVTSYKNKTLFDISCFDTFLEKICSDHVDFKVDVQLASRIFDSAILVLSCVDGVKTKSITMDQQMTRFQLPRLIFIDDLYQEGADLWNIVDQVKSKLNHRCAAIQVPIHFNDYYIGFVDLVKLEAYFFPLKFFARLFDKLKAYFFRSETPDYNYDVEVGEIPEDMQAFVLKKRRELIEIVSEVDDKLSKAFHGGSKIPESVLDDAIRRATISMKFVPIIIGDESYETLKLLMEGVIRYLPSPIDVSNYALDLNKNGEKVELSGSIDAPFVAKAFANWHERFLVWARDEVNKIEEVDEAHAGEIVFVFDAHLESGDTFTANGSVRYTMTSADVPAYSVSKDSGHTFSNGVN